MVPKTLARITRYAGTYRVTFSIILIAIVTADAPGLYNAFVANVRVKLFLAREAADTALAGQARCKLCGSGRDHFNRTYAIDQQAG
jgi:hypothetical protein